MSKCTVRVELHNTSHDSEPYNRLHDAMAVMNLVRTFDKDGDERLLPPAEYRSKFDDTLTAKELADQVHTLATAIHPDGASVIVTKGEGFDSAGTFDVPTPIYHLPGEPFVSGISKCGIPVPPFDIRPSRPEADDQIAVRGGRLCTLCFLFRPGR